jgi:hypothetical protein
MHQAVLGFATVTEKQSHPLLALLTIQKTTTPLPPGLLMIYGK